MIAKRITTNLMQQARLFLMVALLLIGSVNNAQAAQTIPANANLSQYAGTIVAIKNTGANMYITNDAALATGDAVSVASTTPNTDTKAQFKILIHNDTAVPGLQYVGFQSMSNGKNLSSSSNWGIYANGTTFAVDGSNPTHFMVSRHPADNTTWAIQSLSKGAVFNWRGQNSLSVQADGTTPQAATTSDPNTKFIFEIVTPESASSNVTPPPSSGTTTPPASGGTTTASTDPEIKAAEDAATAAEADQRTAETAATQSETDATAAEAESTAAEAAATKAESDATAAEAAVKTQKISAANTRKTAAEAAKQAAIAKKTAADARKTAAQAKITAANARLAAAQAKIAAATH